MLGNFDLKVYFFIDVENAPNLITDLGHDPKVFSNEEMVGHICLNKYDIELGLIYRLNKK